MSSVLRVNAKKIDITPDVPTTFGAGYSSSKKFEGVREPLEANIAVFSEGSEILILVSVDLLYPGRILRVALEEAFPRVRPANIFLAGSHTHRAPLTSSGKPGLGSISHDYAERVCEQLVAAIKALLRETALPIGRFHSASDKINHSINRRLVKDGRSRMAPNPDGDRDELASIVVVEVAGAPALVLWNYACHPVSDPDRFLVASHFPHHVRVALRHHFGEEALPVLFFQGFSGNTRPRGTTHVKRPVDVLRRIKWGPLFYDFSHRRYRRWTQSLSSSVLGLLDQARASEPSSFSAARIERPLSNFASGGSGGPVSFHAVRIGSVVTLLGVSGEAVAEYANWARSHSTATSHTMCVGCIDDTFGYIPVASMLSEGGYESEGFCRNFGLGAVNADVETHTKDAFKQVLEATSNL